MEQILFPVNINGLHRYLMEVIPHTKRNLYMGSFNRSRQLRGEYLKKEFFILYSNIVVCPTGNNFTNDVMTVTSYMYIELFNKLGRRVKAFMDIFYLNLGLITAQRKEVL